MKKFNDLAAQNQILISQLPENLRYEYHIYCDEYSDKFQALFLAELEKLKDDHWLQYRFWDCFTNYTAHHVAGERAKQFLGNEELDKRLSYLYYAYDVDEKNLRMWTLEKEFEFMNEALQKHGVSCTLFDSVINQYQWNVERQHHNGNYPIEKYLDYFDIDDSIKEQIMNDLKVEFFYDDLLIKELYKDVTLENG